MNSHSPPSPPEDLETRLTALLLGELPAEEAASLRQDMAQDAELSRLHDRLAQAIGLVRQATASPNQEPLISSDAPQLSPERRATLLKAFKVIRPKQLERRRTLVRHEWAAVAAMAAGLLIVGALLVAYYRSSKRELDEESGIKMAQSLSAASGSPRAEASSGPADSFALAGEAVLDGACDLNASTLAVTTSPVL